MQGMAENFKKKDIQVIDSDFFKNTVTKFQKVEHEIKISCIFVDLMQKRLEYISQDMQAEIDFIFHDLKLPKFIAFESLNSDYPRNLIQGQYISNQNIKVKLSYCYFINTDTKNYILNFITLQEEGI